MIKLTNKKKIKGDILNYYSGGSTPTTDNVMWLPQTIAELLFGESDKPYQIDEELTTVQVFFLSKSDYTFTYRLSIDGAEFETYPPFIMVPITEEILEGLVEEGFPQEIIDEFRLYLGYDIMAIAAELPYMDSGSHIFRINIDNTLQYSDIIEGLPDKFYYIDSVLGNNGLDNTACGKYYSSIQSALVRDGSLGAYDSQGRVWILVTGTCGEFFVQVPQVLSSGDSIGVDGTIIRGTVYTDYKLPTIPTYVDNYHHTIEFYSATPNGSEWVRNESITITDSNPVPGYYKLESVGNIVRNNEVLLPDIYYNPNTNWEIKFELLSTSTGYLFIGGLSGNNKAYCMISSGKVKVGWFESSITDNTARSVGDVITVKKVGNSLYVNDFRKGTLDVQPVADQNNLQFFKTSASVLIHHFKVYDSNNRIQHNLVGAIHSETSHLPREYGKAAFIDTETGIWYGDNNFLLQGKISNPVLLEYYNAANEHKYITKLPDKLSFSIAKMYNGVEHSRAYSAFNQSINNFCVVYNPIETVTNWDEVIAYSTLTEDGCLLYDPVIPLSTTDYPLQGMSIQGLNFVTGDSAEGVINLIKTQTYNYPTGCTITDNGKRKILIAKLPATAQTLQAYRDYMKQNYELYGFTMSYIKAISATDVENYSPLWEYQYGDSVEWVGDVQPSNYTTDEYS